MRRQYRTRFGGDRPPRAAFEQFHAVQRFQPRNMLADGRRGHAQGARGGMHRAVFDNGSKGEQGFGFGHVGWLSSCLKSKILPHHPVLLNNHLSFCRLIGFFSTDYNAFILSTIHKD